MERVHGTRQGTKGLLATSAGPCHFSEEKITIHNTYHVPSDVSLRCLCIIWAFWGSWYALNALKINRIWLMRFEAIRNNNFPSYRRIRPNPRCEVKSGVCVVNLLILDWKDLPYQTSCQRNIVCVMTFPCAFPLTALFTGSWRHPVLQESLHRSATTSLDLSPWSIPPYKSVASQKAKVHKGARQQNKSASKMQLGVTFRFSCRKGQRA